MTSPFEEPSQGESNAFPDIVDDAAPEDSRYPEPQEPALPGDDFLAATDFGTTVQEQIEGESLDDRLARELPDPTLDPDAGAAPVNDADLDLENRMLSDPEGPVVGRLVEPDQGGASDFEPDAVAMEAFDGESDLSPEESAMHVQPEV